MKDSRYLNLDNGNVVREETAICKKYTSKTNKQRRAKNKLKRRSHGQNILRRLPSTLKAWPEQGHQNE